NIMVPWAAMTVGFLILVHGTSDVGDPSLRTFVKCLVFFLALLGAPLTSSLPWSCGLGCIVLAASTATVFWALAVPMLKGTANDARLTALAAYVSFLLLSLLAVTWGRVGYGIGFAFSSRYATITLLLWMSSFGTIFRYLSIRKKLGYTLNPFIIATASLAFIAASGSTLKPHNSDGIRHYSERTRQAAYFLVSGVLSDDILSWIYPSPSLIRPSIATLRDRHLGIFSDRWGLSVPARLALGAPLGENPKCPLGAVDRITSEGEYGWKVEGWTADPIHKAAPELVLAYNVYGRLLGFSEPLVERADVQAFLKNSTIFFGFIVPLSGILERPFLLLGSDEIRLVAVFSGGYSCLMKGELKG
ncbi:MAG TPA: hypothetical protein VG651_23865, partial [Stellaceae bacterium]|nr:hypothetical protein [Stellaceae bacterium]